MWRGRERGEGRDGKPVTRTRFSILADLISYFFFFAAFLAFFFAATKITSDQLWLGFIAAD
jgi:Na+-driven multidrug efflux pump